MESLKLNDTPVRTVRNFGINNIKIETEIPKEIPKFNNVQITNEKSVIDDKVSNDLLSYGVGNVLEELNKNSSNSKIRIKTSKEKENIKIVYNFNNENDILINMIEIIANGDTDLIIEYNSETNNKCFHSGIIKAKVNNNAKLNVTIINLLNNSSENFESIENKLEKNSNVKYTIVDIGGKTSISNYYSNIIGENAENDLKAIYLGIDNQIKDINYIAELRGTKSSIDIDVQGTLKDNAKKNFKGTIDFKKGAKKARGNESEYCMLLSDKAKSIALPMLLCTEEDVEGNHSAASGKVDEKQLFYIMTRGISYKEAVKLIVKSKFNKIIERISDENLKDKVLSEIDKRLD